ncbi:DivIVA domain-containing protein [Kroppenstedtia sanguinis]
MLTLLDLKNQKFRRAFRGYDREEVDAYMIQVIESFEAITRRTDWSLEQGVPVTAGGKRLLSPLEMHNKEFRITLIGYDRGHVNDFLDRVIQSMEQVIKEKA